MMRLSVLCSNYHTSSYLGRNTQDKFWEHGGPTTHFRGREWWGSAMVPFNRAMICSYRMSIATISLALIVWPQFARQFWSPTASTVRCQPDTPFWGQGRPQRSAVAPLERALGCL